MHDKIIQQEKRVKRETTRWMRGLRIPTPRTDNVRKQELEEEGGRKCVFLSHSLVLARQWVVEDNKMIIKTRNHDKGREFTQRTKQGWMDSRSRHVCVQ